VVGTSLPIESWAPDSIVCTLDLTGPGSNGDVVVEIPGELGRTRKSNVRQLTEWDIPLHYTWTDITLSIGVPGLKYEGGGTLRFRGDVGSYRKTPGTAPYFPTRGMYLTKDSILWVGGSGSVTGGNCVDSLDGSGPFQANTAGTEIPLQIVAVLKVPTGTGQGAIGLGFGVTGRELPFTEHTVCLGNALPDHHPFPNFGPLQGGDYFPFPELDDVWWPVPLPAFSVTFDSQFRILRKTFSGSTEYGNGTITVELMQDVNPSSPVKLDTAR
jgi:hypothetical protein